VTQHQLQAKVKLFTPDHKGKTEMEIKDKG